MTITPLLFACSGKALFERIVPLSMSIDLGKRMAVDVCHAATRRQPLISDVFEHWSCFRFLS